MKKLCILLCTVSETFSLMSRKKSHVLNRQMLFCYLKIYNIYATVYLTCIPVRTAASFPKEGQVRKCIFEYIFMGVILEMAWSRMLRAAHTSKLAGLTRESPEQPDPVLYKQLAPLGHSYYPKIYTHALLLLFPLSPW